MDPPRTPHTSQAASGPGAAGSPTTQSCAEHPVLQAIPLLSADDLQLVAAMVKAPAPTAAAVRAACARCPTREAQLADFLFGPERSTTPPRQVMRAPLTPPRLRRKRCVEHLASVRPPTPPHPPHHDQASSPLAYGTPVRLTW